MFEANRNKVGYRIQHAKSNAFVQARGLTAITAWLQAHAAKFGMRGVAAQNYVATVTDPGFDVADGLDRQKARFNRDGSRK